ncbi:hypothetical protein JYU34_011828 [Plutella xylostella]|uniref:C2H2-type domain-containing protein n=1 Tax=Plutella xylostella TaxID=51655 RepID=A0ABQ7QDU3_PLUXY|nr:hypothetical protein JYU34_011828 [Plutella xylostella]
MLSLYRAWLGPSPCVARPAPPPGAHRPVPRRARAPSPPSSPPPASPSSTTSSELDVEHVESPAPPKETSKSTVLDIASCDGPVRFSRVLNSAWREKPSDPSWCRHRKPRATSVQYYPCKTCGSKFPSYYFVHKHRKRCHADEAGVSAETEHEPDPEPSTSTAAAQ